MKVLRTFLLPIMAICLFGGAQMVAAMDSSSELQLTEATREGGALSRDVITGIIFMAALIIIAIVYIAFKVRERAHEDGITGFWNIFTALMNCEFSDDCSDGFSENGEVLDDNPRKPSNHDATTASRRGEE